MILHVMWIYSLTYCAAVSLIAFFAYGIDKYRAKRGKRRTPEATLLCLGFFGGAAGALLGMSLFRHKTLRLDFWLVNWLSLLCHVLLILTLRFGMAD